MRFRVAALALGAVESPPWLPSSLFQPPQQPQAGLRERVEPYKISFETRYTNTGIRWKNSTDPPSAFDMDRGFLDLPKIRVKVAGTADDGSALSAAAFHFWLFSFATTIWAVEQPDPWWSCRFLEPLPTHGVPSAPGQKPTPQLRT